MDSPGRCPNPNQEGEETPSPPDAPPGSFFSAGSEPRAAGEKKLPRGGEGGRGMRGSFFSDAGRRNVGDSHDKAHGRRPEAAVRTAPR
eukprot:scaffold24_cov341-Pavlova_lutheri.AAC.48